MPINKKQILAMRREKVLELLSTGLRQEEIAQQLMCSQPTISADITYLRKDAEAFVKENRKHLAFEYKQVMSNLHLLRRKAWKHLEETTDEVIKTDLYEILEGINASILNVLSAGDIIQAEVLHAKDDVVRIRDGMNIIEEFQKHQSSQAIF